jgi:uncharacterized protein involved in type VI secretion and phage assembly
MPESTTTYTGKYRGTVVNNLDPMKQGRIQVQVADVTALTPTTWMNPCLPIAGIQSGLFTIPPVGAGVWVEFEQGDINNPIWLGGFWGSAATVPALAQATPPGLDNLTIQTTGQHTLMISDLPGPTGGILIKHRLGAMISISESGIVISNGQGATIMMTGPTVAVNGTALVVT